MAAAQRSGRAVLRMAAAQRSVTLITRVGCHLCADAEVRLAELATELGFSLEVLDVDADRVRANEYSDRVPVFLIDGAEHGYWRLEEARFRAALDR
ncbi:MAG: glutaredoxin family protein [Actinomycetota bacterium]|nr:glutaredoxin family protein [Actinomycetota bacterium]MDQ2956079.1 glutaredoxin family protein [Actinomycetota bacterium]